jgi:hypothetical protein
MSSSENDLIAATLMIDGGYNDSVFVVPFRYCTRSKSIAFDVYARMEK